MSIFVHKQRLQSDFGNFLCRNHTCPRSPQQQRGKGGVVVRSWGAIADTKGDGGTHTTIITGSQPLGDTFEKLCVNLEEVLIGKI